MIKNSKWLLAICCACVALGAAVGCNETENSSNGQTVTLTLVQESATLELFEEYELQYDYNGEGALSWTVTDPSIVSVSGGKIVALKEGETTVFVQSGELSDSCVVKVNGVKAELISVSAGKTALSLYAGDTYTLTPVVKYGAKTIDGASFSYESSNPSVVTVSDGGLVTATAVGQASISVTASVLGQSVGCIVNVAVDTSGKISVNTVQTELYALAEYEGKTYKNEAQLTATVTEKGVKKNDATVVWTSSNAGVATVENGKIVAVGVGEAEITATYLGEDGNSVTAVSFVNVVPVTHTVTDTTDVVKTKAFTVDGLQTAIVSAYVTDGVLKTEVPVVEGKLDFSQIAFVGKTTLLLDAGNVLLNMPVYLWTDGISTAEGLQAILSSTDGHYRLESDLDLTGVAWTYAEPVTFKGVFDGGNHTLTGFAPTDCGLFYELGNGAKIQNLAFENATLLAGNTAVGCLAASVAENATVTIENITGNIINNGNACGGLLGRIARNASVTLKNANLHIYAANTQGNGGALVGCADSAILMPEETPSVIYTNINLCGTTAYEGFENSAKDAINALKAVRPTPYGQTLNIYEVMDGGKRVTLSGTGIVKATLFASTVSEVAFDGSITLPESEARGFVGNNFELIMEQEDGTLLYYAFALEYGELKLTNENKELLKYARGGVIVLQEDIDLGGETWVTKASFAGTLDGNGYAIKNLTTSGNDGSYYGLFLNIAGEVKNIAFVGVKLGANSGVLAGRATAKLAINNVFIQVAKTTSGRASATVERSTIEGVTINITDTVIVMPKTITKEYIYGYQVRGLSTLTNVHCVGLKDGAYSETGANYVATAQSTVTFHTDKVAFNLALDEENSAVTLTQSNKQFVQKYYALEILKIGQANANSLLTLKGDEFVYLTEDIDLAGITWNSTVAFTGTFDGGNHAIKNLTTVGNNGFFNTAQGTIRNVAFVDVYTGGNSAVIAYKPTGTLTLENIFIDISGREGWSGATLYTNGAGEYAANMTNVVINFPAAQTNYNIFGYLLKGLSTLNNVHAISGSGKYARENDYTKGYIKAGSTVTFHANLAAFNAAQKTLTEFLTACVTNYLN